MAGQGRWRRKSVGLYTPRMLGTTLGRVAIVLAVWAAGAALLCWPRLPGPWRRAPAPATRFWLEKVAAPPAWCYAVGVTWLAPVVGAFFAFNLRRERKGKAALLTVLLLYALAVRGAVAALMVAASTLRLGSHYDVSALV